MDYAVDIAIAIMNKITEGSAKAPVMFQRDSTLYIASPQGFAQVTVGLELEPRREDRWTPKREGPIPTDAICARDEAGKMQFIEGERQYISAISYGPDTDASTLEEIAKAAEAMQNLPDDGKIRMILHDSGYHSHKYGYAADGMDVWVSKANVMGREDYLTLARSQEQKAIDKLEALVENIEKIEDHERATNIYTERLKNSPDCTILTPNMLVSLPRRGTLDPFCREPDSWTMQTQLEQHWNGSGHGGILHYRDISTYDEGQFAVNIVMNSREMRTATKESLSVAQTRILQAQSKELNAVLTTMDAIARYVGRLNRVHNLACAGNLEWKRDMRKSMKAREEERLRT
jgi:hypothetical protein